MGIDRHEEQRRGSRKKRPALRAPAVPDPAPTSGPPAPMLIPDAGLPAGPMRLEPAPPVAKPLSRLRDDDRHDMRVPRSWIVELAALTGEDPAEPMAVLRATVVLMRYTARMHTGTRQ